MNVGILKNMQHRIKKGINVVNQQKIYILIL